MLDKYEEIQNKKDFNIYDVSYQLDSMDKVFLLSDVDELYVPSKGVMHIDARFGFKILPIGVEILRAKRSPDLASDKA